MMRRHNHIRDTFAKRIRRACGEERGRAIHGHPRLDEDLSQFPFSSMEQKFGLSFIVPTSKQSGVGATESEHGEGERKRVRELAAGQLLTGYKLTQRGQTRVAVRGKLPLRDK